MYDRSVFLELELTLGRKWTICSNITGIKGKVTTFNFSACVYVHIFFQGIIVFTGKTTG